MRLVVALLTLALAAEGLDLEQQQRQQIDPVREEALGSGPRDHEKRTIFGPGPRNHGWAKHVGRHPSGFKYVLGYGPVDLKLVPVIKPISVKFKQKWPVRQLVLKPLVPARKPGWKPAHPPNVPPRPGGNKKPWHQQGWAPQRPVHKPAVPAQPVVPVRPVVPIQPVVPVQPAYPVNPAVPVKPAVIPPKPYNHHVFQLQPAPLVPAAKPLVPVQPVQPALPVQPIGVPPPYPIQPFNALRPFVPSIQLLPGQSPGLHFPVVPPQQILQQPLFHVTKPDLPVLPLGATFQSPIFRYAALQPRPQVFQIPVPPPLATFQPANPPPPLQPLQPINPPQVPFQHQLPVQPVFRFLPNQMPGKTLVEFHGVPRLNPLNYQPVTNQLPALPQFPVHPHQLPHPQEQHDAQVPSVPQNPAQQPPIEHHFNHHAHFTAPEQDAAYEDDYQSGYQQQDYEQQELQRVQAQQLLQFEREELGRLQGLRQQQSQSVAGDLQIPQHLPQHPQFFENDPGSASVLRPADSLEPPFKK